MTVLSLHPAKIMTTGEGGAVLTDRDDLAARAAPVPEPRHRDRAGRPDGLDVRDGRARLQLPADRRRGGARAAAQLERLEEFLARRGDLAARYLDRLAGHPPSTLPAVEPDARSGVALHVRPAPARPARRRSRRRLPRAARRGDRGQRPLHPGPRSPVLPRALPGPLVPRRRGRLRAAPDAAAARRDVRRATSTTSSPRWTRSRARIGRQQPRAERRPAFDRARRAPAQHLLVLAGVHPGRRPDRADVPLGQRTRRRRSSSTTNSERRKRRLSCLLGGRPDDRLAQRPLGDVRIASTIRRNSRPVERERRVRRRVGASRAVMCFSTMQAPSATAATGDGLAERVVGQADRHAPALRHRRDRPQVDRLGRRRVGARALEQRDLGGAGAARGRRPPRRSRPRWPSRSR